MVVSRYLESMLKVHFKVEELNLSEIMHSDWFKLALLMEFLSVNFHFEILAAAALSDFSSGSLVPNYRQ